MLKAPPAISLALAPIMRSRLAALLRAGQELHPPCVRCVSLIDPQSKMCTEGICGDPCVRQSSRQLLPRCTQTPPAPPPSLDPQLRLCVRHLLSSHRADCAKSIMVHESKRRAARSLTAMASGVRAKSLSERATIRRPAASRSSAARSRCSFRRRWLHPAQRRTGR